MNGFYRKLIFLVAVLALGLISRAAYEMNTGAAPSGASHSLAMIASDVPSFSAAATDTAENGTAAAQSAAAAQSSGALSGNPPAAQNAGDPLAGILHKEALVADLQTGKIIFGENDAVPWPLASVTKLMTATVVMDNLSMNQKVTITPAAFAVYPEEQTLRPGDTYTVADLLHFLLMPSSNVAAEALADAYGRTRFLAAMNARAIAWGMADTHYDDPSGLSSANRSTADNLVLLAQKIYADYPQILAITRTAEYDATNLSTGTVTPVKSINAFAGEPDFIGGKTGYTDSADGNLLSIFSDNGRPIMVIVLGANDYERFTDTEKLYDWFKQQSLGG